MGMASLEVNNLKVYFTFSEHLKSSLIRGAVFGERDLITGRLDISEFLLSSSHDNEYLKIHVV